MKEKVILSYSKGITHSPSDLLCSDGELEECVNLEVKDGELVPMEMPMKLGFSLEDGERLVLVHNTKLDEKNYVTVKDGELRIFKIEDDTKKYIYSIGCGNIKSIQYVGNSIVFYTKDSPHYLIYSGGRYKSLGKKFPELNLSFNLIGELSQSEIFEVDAPDEDFESEAFQEQVLSQLKAEVNKFIEGESVGKGRFMYPFFVRYALRLFDGSHTCHSAPILMLPSTHNAPSVFSYGTTRSTVSGKSHKTEIGAILSRLNVKVNSVDSSFSDWSDIIQGVDIFVSRQISSYDQNGTTFSNNAYLNTKFVGSYNSSSTIWDTLTILHENTKLEYETGNPEFFQWAIPTRTTDELVSEITSTSLFYKYTSLNLDSISIGYNEVLSGNLSSLEVGETLTDDYMTHDILVPESSFVYNGRLNISNITRRLFNGFPVDSMANMVTEAVKDGMDYDLLFGQYVVYTYIKSSNGGSDIVVKSSISNRGALYGTYLFYPDSDAYKMVIEDTSNYRYAVLQLSEHPLLNGAYAFIGFNSMEFTSGSAGVNVTDNAEAQLNKLYVSNVNNIYHFPLEGIYTVGSDRIIGLSAITRPISQGQFGEFPLIVFCSDGNYALRVDEQGFYSAISPVQEDVVLGSDKITPMENSIMIITKKGMMLTSGGEMTKVAPQMDGGVLETSTLEGVDTTNSVFSNIIEKTSDKLGFLSYLYGSRMAFDYASNRILVYNPDKSYAYIYKFDNGTVTKLMINNGAKIVTSVIDYPDTIIQDETGALYSLYTKEDISSNDTQQNGLALTRPLKMGGAMSMKAVKQIMSITTHGGKDSFVKYLLYGSNDNVKYYRVSSRFGKPYKFYRVAIYTSLLPKESLSGTVMTIEERRTHKLR